MHKANHVINNSAVPFIPPVEQLATVNLFQILPVSPQNASLSSKHHVQYAKPEVSLPTCFTTCDLLFMNSCVSLPL